MSGAPVTTALHPHLLLMEQSVNKKINKNHDHTVAVCLPQLNLIDSGLPEPQLNRRTHEPPSRCSSLSLVDMIFTEFYYSAKTRLLLPAIVSPWQQESVWCSASWQTSVFSWCVPLVADTEELRSCYSTACWCTAVSKLLASAPHSRWLFYFGGVHQGTRRKFHKPSFLPILNMLFLISEPKFVWL